MKRTFFLLASFLGLFFLHCEIINPEESVPAFLYIEPFRLDTDELVQGSADEKITEVWVTVADQFLGAYALPATVPILMAGEVEVMLEAGIKDNGIGSTPEIYPFYRPYRVQVDLLPGQMTTVKPVTSYEPTTRFAFIEDFESGSTIFRDTLLGNTGLQVSSVEPFEGNFSGKLHLNTNTPLIELATVDAYGGLTDNSPLVYLEVNYRSDVPVIFGLVGGAGTGSPSAAYDPGFNPKATWNKIYFNLSGLLATSPFDRHQLGFRAFLPTEDGRPGMEQGTVCLDNIKLVHF